MARRMNRNVHVRCRTGEKVAIVSKPYLLLWKIMPTIHIESKKEDIASVVLMPGDPKRSEYIANNFLKNVKLVNNVRGMTAFTGYYKNKLVTIFPSGMGNASMGIYSYELFTEYNVETIIRIGSCGSYRDELNLNDVILVTETYSDSSFAKVLDNYSNNTIKSNSEINTIIEQTSNEINMNIIKGIIYSSDVFYAKENNYQEKVTNYNVLGVEMETFALFNNARTLNKKASAIVTISDFLTNDKKLSSEEREKGLNKMITLALESSLKI